MSWLGWVGGDYGYWININIPICILTHWPALGTVLWPPTFSLRTWLHIRKSYSREKKPSTVSCVQASSHRLERPLQYFYQGCPGWSTPDYNIQVGTVFTLFHKNLGKEIKGDQSTWYLRMHIPMPAYKRFPSPIPTKATNNQHVSADNICISKDLTNQLEEKNN